MGSTWKLNEKSTGELKTTISGDIWKDAQEKATNKLIKNVKLDGFREGQVPKELAKKQLNSQNILMEAIDEIAQHALTEGIKEHDLWVIARPELGVDKIDENEVTLSFTIAVKPTVTLGEYKKLDVKKEDATVSDEEVDADLTNLQARYAELVLKEEGSVEQGDTAVIDFEGFKDGVAFEGGKGDNFPLEIGSNQFIPGFEEQLIGMKSEETKDINVTFPEEYQAEDLAGKEVVFKVTLHEIKAKELPAIDDELIKLAEIENIETLDAYKEKVRSDMLAQKETDVKNNFTNELLTKVVENATVEIPDIMVEEETDNLVNDFANRLQSQGFSIEQFTQMTGQDMNMIREQMKTDAYSKVNVRLVLDAIAEKEALQASDEEVETEYQNIADQYSMELDKVKELLSHDAVLYDLRLRKALQLIEDSASE